MADRKTPGTGREVRPVHCAGDRPGKDAPEVVEAGVPAFPPGSVPADGRRPQVSAAVRGLTAQQPGPVMLPPCAHGLPRGPRGRRGPAMTGAGRARPAHREPGVAHSPIRTRSSLR
ncbi:hypothetical protein EES45_35315 [Streptomyces sp. ADI97-07]|uniref:Uncharacterized protein n=1 Tax=Streptomyces clavifer TaxID=68188 RepID=A0ABS4VIA1_9ACTN|nr:hypothetical protein [Streptomyces clavifer]RPK70772.1 hypothetical protein EES45_35315 [Streptomyces sp. ADI97-07]